MPTWYGKENNDEDEGPSSSKGSGNELFCRTTECGEILESNGACAEDLDPDTANNVELLKSAVISRVERSFEKIPGIIASRKITSNRAGGLRWSGIYVSNEVFTSLKKEGDIYEEVLRRFNVKLVFKRPPGRPTVEPMVRLSEISW